MITNRYEHDEEIILINNPDIVKYAKDGDLNKVIELFLSGVNLDSKNVQGDTALIIASPHSYLDIVKELLKYGADVNIKNKYGDTALIWASYKGNLDIIKELLKHNADVNIKNNDGKTAFNYAKGKVKKYFISKGITA